MTSKVIKTQRFVYCDFQYVMVQPWKEQSLVSSESGKCVRVGRHVYSRTVVALS